MHNVEFEADVRNGIINIPDEYKDNFKKRVKVILISEEKSIANNFIDELLSNPVKVNNFQPMSREEIYERGWTKKR